MGLLSTLRLVDSLNDQENNSAPKITAQYAPPVMEQSASLFYQPSPFISRAEAMAVPSVTRARDLICGIIGSTPLELYRKSTGQELGSPLWLEQPDQRQPRGTTIAYTVDSLLFFGVAYWEVTSQYADDGRPSRFAWVSNDRVTLQLNSTNTLVEKYYVDGTERPMSGLGSLVTFQALSDGILSKGGRVLRAALDLQKAASISASTPMPTGYIQNSGADLPEEQIQGLLSSWKLARQQRSTAYLSATLKYEPTQFSPKDMAYNEASQFMSTEIARLCNVPAYMLSADMNSSLTYSNVLDERRQFVDMSLRPYYTAIEERLSMDDITKVGNQVRFSISDTFLRADDLTRLAVIEKMLTLGLITLDQAMEMEELTPNGNNAPNI
jgi:HK97 family phage portal protein